MKNNGNVNGPSCSNVCSTALCGSGTFHNCDSGRPVGFSVGNLFYLMYPLLLAPIYLISQVLKDISAFAAVAKGLGFTCKKGGCWSGVAPGTGLMLVSIKTNNDGQRMLMMMVERN